MKLQSKRTCALSLDATSAAFSDFAELERRLVRRGIAIERRGDVSPPSVGASWEATFKWREKSYDVLSTITRYEPEKGYEIESKGSGIACRTAVRLEAIEDTKTLVDLSLDLSATSLTARVVLNTLRLSKSSLNDRLSTRLADFIADIEPSA